MNEALLNLCDALDELSDLVTKATTEERPLTQVHGWHHPALSRNDLANLPARISSRIKEANINDIDKEIEEIINRLPGQIKFLHGNTISHMFNGNGHQAIPAFINTMQWIDTFINQLFQWEFIDDTKAMPASLARRIRSLKIQVNEVSVDKSKLEKQIQLIDKATSAAESLPTDLEALKDARIKIDKNLAESIGERAKIKELLEKSLNDQYIIDRSREETDKLVDKCEEAYRITTTKGLSAAFEQRAKKLSISMWVWVFGLMSALILGAYIGSHRIELLPQSTVKKK